jgi:(2Fe-2S) ferredoxin
LFCVNRRFQSDKGSCAEKGSEAFADELERGITERGIDIELERIRCLGQCAKGPAMRFAPGGKFFLGVQSADIADILDQAERLCGTRKPTRADSATKFFRDHNLLKSIPYKGYAQIFRNLLKILSTCDRHHSP